jgi:hypothetical protein
MAAVPEVLLRWKRTARLIPSRFPVAGLLDRVADAGDLEAVFELEGWTNDRISAELGVLHCVPRDEWVSGQPMSSVVMAAFCHPKPGGGRFSDARRGAWYAARAVDTALAESIHHRTREIAEVGTFDVAVQMRLYLADFAARFADVRRQPPTSPLYDPDDYAASQRFASDRMQEGANGIVYRSVRHAGGECLACFRPALVRNVRVGGHFEYRWEGAPEPRVRRL